MEGKEAGRYVMMCIYVNKKELYCVVNAVSVRIEELNWGSWHCGTEVGVDLCVHCSCGAGNNVWGGNIHEGEWNKKTET